MPRDGAEALDGAKSDRDQSHVVVHMGFMHLDQVLLAGQSVTMAEEHDHVDTGKGAKGQLAAVKLGKRDIPDIGLHALSARHVRLLAGALTKTCSGTGCRRKP